MLSRDLPTSLPNPSDRGTFRKYEHRLLLVLKVQYHPKDSWATSELFGDERLLNTLIK